MKRLVFIIMVCILLTSCGQQSAVLTWQEQYDLGVRFLSEGNYEEAILAFNTAIKIDPMQAPAFVARADAYMNATGAQYDMAEQDYLKAIELDSSAAETYLKLAELYILLGDTEAALAILEQGVEITGDSGLKEMLSTQKQATLNIPEDVKQHFQWYFKKMQVGDYESVLQQSIADGSTITGNIFSNNPDGRALCYDGKTFSTDMDGIGIKIILDQVYTVYYGDLLSGIPNGQGIAVRIFDTSGVLHYFRGEWKNGKPNGSGIAVQDAGTGGETYEGTWLSGLAYGEIIHKMYVTAFQPGDQPYAEWHYACSDGKPIIDDRWLPASNGEKHLPSVGSEIHYHSSKFPQGFAIRWTLTWNFSGDNG